MNISKKIRSLPDPTKKDIKIAQKNIKIWQSQPSKIHQELFLKNLSDLEQYFIGLLAQVRLTENQNDNHSS